ncbi:MAG: hypothetical protein IPK32_02180 [Verrucomicrobiaceae bacterium]|nr:hypothetical protein [Verrucomicrobiaceae bacterium]
MLILDLNELVDLVLGEAEVFPLLLREVPERLRLFFVRLTFREPLDFFCLGWCKYRITFTFTFTSASTSTYVSNFAPIHGGD